MTIHYSFLCTSPRVIMRCNPHRFAIRAATHDHTRAWQTLKHGKQYFILSLSVVKTYQCYLYTLEELDGLVMRPTIEKSGKSVKGILEELSPRARITTMVTPDVLTQKAARVVAAKKSQVINFNLTELQQNLQNYISVQRGFR